MALFEYKVVPAPNQGQKAKGVKGTGDRFALALTDALNEMAEEGWEYVRAETLPCDERKGLRGSQTTFQNMLVFRRVAGRTKGDGALALPPLELGEPTNSSEPPVGHDGARREPTLRAAQDDN